jgi:transposase
MVKRVKLKGPFKVVFDFLKGLKTRFAICYEASCGYGYIHDCLRRIACRVVVAHPGQLRLIFRSKKKSDRVDAEKLAKLLFLDQVPNVHVPSMDIRSWRSLIEYRHRLVGKRTRAKNGFRSLFRNYGLELPSGRRLWTRKGLSQAMEVDLPTSHAMLQRDLLLEELTTLNSQVKRVEKELADIASRHPGVNLLMTIPGVGIRTAEAVVAYIDDAQRFTRNKTVGSYFGLVPCQDESAGRDRLGHITREGPGTVRKMLVESSWQSIRHSPQIRRFFERVQRGDPKRKKIALIATAHYLVRVMHAILRSGEVWREESKQKKVA